MSVHTRHWTTLSLLTLMIALVGCNAAPKNDASARADSTDGLIEAPAGSAAAGAQSAIDLGEARSYAVLSGSTVTSTGKSAIDGDLGVSPGTAVTGFPPGTLTGMRHSGDSQAAAAMSDLVHAYKDAASRSTNPVVLAGNLGGRTLTPGLYKSSSSLEISSGDLTLDAGGDANAIFLFQIESALTTTSGRAVILTNGARAGNIYWLVGSSATLGTKSVFKGNILADQSITIENGAALTGRALARTGAVTLDANAVVLPN